MQASEAALLKKILLKFVKPHISKFLLLTALITIGVVLSSAYPYIYGKILDAVNNSNLKTLIFFMAVYCATTVFALILSMIESYFGERISLTITNSLKYEFFSKVIKAKCELYSKFTSGELLSRINVDVNGIVGFFINIITDFGQLLINFSMSIFFVITISTKLSTVAIFYLPATFVLTAIIRVYMKKLAIKQHEYDDEHFTFLTDTITNNFGIKAFVLENSILNKYTVLLKKNMSLSFESLKLGNYSLLFSNVITLASSMFIIYLSAVLIIEHQLTIGTMVAFNTYINILFASVNKIWGYRLSFQSVVISAQRIEEFYNSENEYTDTNKFAEENIKIQQIQFNDVCFSYPECSNPAINELSISFTKNGLYSIVGHNGCGKSTLAKLLVRFYEPSDGSILINGQPINTFSLYQIRNSITYISKEDFFFIDTIKSNLLIAAPSASDIIIEKACIKAGIHDFVISLPQQYNTILGEKGVNLSSGQKQKLSIARALLRNSKVLVFDEPTSNLDGLSGKIASQTFRELQNDHIVIIISHTLSTIKDSTRIFLMQAGTVIEQGTHNELLKTSTEYRSLFNTVCKTI